MAIVPSSRPKATQDRIESIILRSGVVRSHHPVVLIGVRGYYSDTMGEKGKNDRKLYDDAIFICSPTLFSSFNGNTDPGAFKKGIANLKTGTWLYKLGIHGLSKPKFLQYTALVQAARVTVKRDDVGDDSGYFGINIHKGGRLSVSSIGCQTIYPSQWSEFIARVQEELKLHGQTVVPYILINEEAAPVPVASTALSWEKNHPERAAWSKALLQFVSDDLDRFDQAKDTHRFGTGYAQLSRENKVRFWAEIIVSMAYYESAWNPHSKYMEPAPLNKYSIGLLQLSYDDEKNYRLNLGLSEDAKSLEDPILNLKMGVIIMGRLIAKYGAISTPENKGAAAYWSVLREKRRLPQVVERFKSVWI